MPVTANNLLAEILGVVSKIERKIDNDNSSKEKGKSKVGISSILSSLGRTKEDPTEVFLKFSEKLLEITDKTKNPDAFKTFTEGITELSKSLPHFVESLNDLENIKARKLEKSINILSSFLNMLSDYGDNRSQRRLKNTINTFKELSRSSRNITRMFDSFGKAMVMLSVSMLVFVGSLVLMGALFGVSPGMAALAFAGSMALILGSFWLLGKFRRSIMGGVRTAKSMGMAVGILSLALVGFGLSLVVLGALFGTNAIKGVAMFVAIIGLITLTFVGLGIAGRIIREGAQTARIMGVAMAFLAGGLIVFAISLKMINSVLSNTMTGEEGGEEMSFGKSFLRNLGGVGFMLLVIGGMATVFGLIGMFDRQIKQGATTGIIMAIAMGVLALGLLMFIGVAKVIQELDEPGKTLALVGLAVAGLIGLYSAIGAASPIIATGAGVILLVSASLFALTATIKYTLKTFEEVVNTMKRIENLIPAGKTPYEYVSISLTDMISSLLIGTAKGILYGLTGKKPGENINFKDIINASGNVAILMTGLGVLRKVSKTVSKFAQAITAFAQLGNLKIIERFEPDGTPVFGETVDVRKVTNNMTDTFAYFLQELISKTEGLTKKHAKAIKKMGRSLTGKRGILSAVVDFTEALKAYAEFGPTGEIGYSFFEESGTDQDGNPKYIEKRGKVDIKTVTQNMVNSFMLFVNEMITKFGGSFYTPQTKRRLKKMGKALTGKHGIMESVVQFAEALKIYAEFGERNEIGYSTYDDKGNEIRFYIPVNTVVSNMIGSFVYFAESMFSRSESEFGDGEPEGRGISGKQRRRMKRMTKALTGKHGILGAIIQFAETLKLFSEFGDKNELPVFDADGNPVMVGKKQKTISIDKIANNIVTTLTTFSDTLSTKLETSNAKDAKKAIKKYDDMIDSLNKLSSATDGLSRLSTSITDLANSIGSLGKNLDTVNLSNLNKIAATAEKYSISLKEAGVPVYEQSPTTKKTTFNNGGNSTIVNSPSYKEPDWDKLTQQIGANVGEQVAASLKNGHFIFEFDMSKTGGTYYWTPK